VAIVLLLNVVLLVVIIRNIVKSSSQNFVGENVKAKIAIWRRG
jgi:hypothetical protein